jgi:hypothetical protein
MGYNRSNQEIKRTALSFGITPAILFAPLNIIGKKLPR